MAERAPTPITVKRYSGSRLYDAHAARHVTLQGIAETMLVEQSVAVYDAASGRHCALVLTMIIAD